MIKLELQSAIELHTEAHTEEFLDKTDRKILNILQKDNQITNLALAETIGISALPCFRPVKRLRETGVIVKDVSLVDPLKLADH